MSRAISTIGKPFGLQRVCQALDFPRATIYAERARALSNVAQLAPMRAVRSPRRRTDSCSRRSVPIWLVRRSSAKGRARSGHACAFRTTSACPAPVWRG
ncbi:MAG: hypothetical protein VB137_07565 [Burkholderia sp.]